MTTAPATLAKPMMAPWLRSMPAMMMTKVWPIATAKSGQTLESWLLMLRAVTRSGKKTAIDSEIGDGQIEDEVLRRRAGRRRSPTAPAPRRSDRLSRHAKPAAAGAPRLRPVFTAAPPGHPASRRHGERREAAAVAPPVSQGRPAYFFASRTMQPQVCRALFGVVRLGQREARIELHRVRPGLALGDRLLDAVERELGLEVDVLHAGRIDVALADQLAGAVVAVEAAEDDVAFLAGLLPLAACIEDALDGREEEVRRGEDEVDVRVGGHRRFEAGERHLRVPLGVDLDRRLEDVRDGS